MKIFFILLSSVCLSVACNGQKLHVSDKGVITIDTTISVDSDPQAVYNKLKKWAIINVPDFNSMVKGEINPDLLKFLHLTDYWAMGGSRQKYSEDVTFEIYTDRVVIRVDQLRTFVPDKNVHPMQQARKGWSADKFFKNSKGDLKPSFSKFYTDVESQFKSMVADIFKGDS